MDGGWLKQGDADPGGATRKHKRVGNGGAARHQEGRHTAAGGWAERQRGRREGREEGGKQGGGGGGREPAPAAVLQRSALSSGMMISAVGRGPQWRAGTPGAWRRPRSGRGRERRAGKQLQAGSALIDWLKGSRTSWGRELLLLLRTLGKERAPARGGGGSTARGLVLVCCVGGRRAGRACLRRAERRAGGTGGLRVACWGLGAGPSGVARGGARGVLLHAPRAHAAGAALAVRAPAGVRAGLPLAALMGESRAAAGRSVQDTVGLLNLPVVPARRKQGRIRAAQHPNPAPTCCARAGRGRAQTGWRAAMRCRKGWPAASRARGGGWARRRPRPVSLPPAPSRPASPAPRCSRDAPAWATGRARAAARGAWPAAARPQAWRRRARRRAR